MPKIVKTISLDGDVLERFLDLNPNINFSAWVNLRMIHEINGNEFPDRAQLSLDDVVTIVDKDPDSTISGLRKKLRSFRSLEASYLESHKDKPTPEKLAAAIADLEKQISDLTK